MKRSLILAAALFLTGCAAPQAYETVTDEYIQAEAEQAQQVNLWLPEDAAIPVIGGESGETLYLCDGYTLSVHTLPAGDLDQSLRELTGFSRDALTVVQTAAGAFVKTECIWTAAGEAEEQVGRLLLLDDGAYHYALAAMAPASGVKQAQAQWDAVFNGFSVGDQNISTGS